MEQSYTSIKQEVLKKLEADLPYLKNTYGITIIGIFGSVSRGEDTPESDIDIIYHIDPERVDYDLYLQLTEHLEQLFGRKIDMIPPPHSCARS